MKISILCQETEGMPHAEYLANKYGWSLNQAADVQLLYGSERIALKVGQFKPLSVDFCQGNLAKRLSKAGKNQPLAKACLASQKPVILDLSAGWGRDSAILASLGATVTMLERNPVQVLLLEDGLRRLRSSGSVLSKHLSLVHDDAIGYLSTLNKELVPDVIYFDPMHPERDKAALVKKDMQVLQQIIGEDSDKKQVAELALSHTNKRLVIKWPRKKAPLLENPQFSLVGKTIRYDVYLPPESKAATTMSPAAIENKKK